MVRCRRPADSQVAPGLTRTIPHGAALVTAWAEARWGLRFDQACFPMAPTACDFSLLPPSLNLTMGRPQKFLTIAHIYATQHLSQQPRWRHLLSGEKAALSARAGALAFEGAAPRRQAHR